MGEIFVEIEKQFSRIGKEFQTALDRLQHEGEKLDSFSPRADMLETETTIRILVDLPGLTREQVQLSLKNGVMIVKGERATDHLENEQFTRRERFYGQFYRSFALPETASSKEISARFINGVLEITIPKTGSPQGDIPIS